MTKAMIAARAVAPRARLLAMTMTALAALLAMKMTPRVVALAMKTMRLVGALVMTTTRRAAAPATKTTLRAVARVTKTTLRARAVAGMMMTSSNGPFKPSILPSPVETGEGIDVPSFEDQAAFAAEAKRLRRKYERGRTIYMKKIGRTMMPKDQAKTGRPR